MKPRIIATIAIFEILSIIFPVGIFTPSALAQEEYSSEPAPGPKYTSPPTCDDRCDQYYGMVASLEDGSSCCGKAGAAKAPTCDSVVYDGNPHTIAECKQTQIDKYG